MKEFPTFKRGEVQKLYGKLPKKEKEIIADYVKYVSISSSSQRRLKNVERSLTQFRILTKKDFDKVTLSDLRDFLAMLNRSNKTQATRNEIKHTIKRFLRWKFKDWSDRFDNLSDIKLHMGINEEKLNANTILKKEDIDKIKDAENSIFWQAFFITLYESGLRPIELRTLTWDRIRFDIEDDISEINIFATKTHKARSVFVKEATYYLKRVKEESNSEYVFPSVRDKYKPMGKEPPAVWLKRISEKVLGRAITPYILRHTRATELYTNSDLPDKVVQKFLGHSKSMSDVYTHLSSDGVKNAMSKSVYKKRKILSKKEEDKLQKRVEYLEKNFEASKKLLKYAEEIIKLQSQSLLGEISKAEFKKKIEALR